MLVGPVFSAGSVTSERERQTLDLLLTTIITPWQILWGKLIAGLRVSSVLTMFLLWPVLLACVMVSSYWTNLPSVAAYVAIVLMTCLTTAMLALFCSVIFQKTAHSLMITYLLIIVLFCLPLAAAFFGDTFFPTHPATEVIKMVGVTSPFAAAFHVPLDVEVTIRNEPQENIVYGWLMFAAYVVVNLGLNAVLLASMMWLFNVRWRVAG
jgi:ABC-type transport system involved in multi-copper enzyme maturation permease subunit